MTARQLHRVEALWAPANPNPADTEPWMDFSLCKEIGGDVFFPEKGESTKPAKRVCQACPVRSECLEYALRNDERFGIWGGLSEQERRKLKKPTSLPSAPTEKECATCGLTKPLTSFHRNGATSDGYRTDCKKCRNEAELRRLKERAAA